MAVTGGYDYVAVWQGDTAVSIAFDLDGAGYFACRVILPYDAVGAVAYEVVAVWEFSCNPHLGVGIGLVGCELDGFEDFAFAIDLEDFTWAGKRYEMNAVGEGLAGVDLVGFFGFVLPDNLFVAGDFAGAPQICEEDVAVGQLPYVLGTRYGILPDNVAFGGDYMDHVAAIIGAQKRMWGWRGIGCGVELASCYD